MDPTITGTHGKGELAKAMLTRVSGLLPEWKSIVEQLTSASVWQRVVSTLPPP
ncbi:MAG TPA: hypothetical protein VM532_16770 [Burkholderiales bacterium]|nr:hypothetical protein [Burkholderiales bacterium]